ncbi:DMT family transporter [Sneathiella sp. HT1-7]|jgi:drug/metabolite transporter (DMT)-like permease|uniref:DMT family transporter n=1 Tax=Sneathiella sp. HT1-7 TaxID=2887192 RepID=UPI001D13E175|nr:DMT family transporter [Sneathiella sp. HT1-7]MCC3303293.1 DMT family transporter [Sneathiella sp. HT1-7]
MMPFRPGSSAHTIFSRIPANGQGALWMLLGGFFFSCMGVGIKFLGEGMDSFQIAFLRALFGFIVILPFALRRGISGLKTKVLRLHIARAVVGILGMLSIFYAITQLPLADAVALTFTRPLFLILLAVLFLGEMIRWRRWTATAVGFIGVLVMVQSQGEFEFASLVALFGALMVAMVSVFLKKLSATEAPPTMMFYFGLFASIISAVPAMFVWIQPSFEDIAILVLLACFGSGANFCAIRAFSVGEATAVAPFDYTRLIFSGFLGFFIFAEVPTLAMLIGACIIVASSLYIVRREAGLGKKKPAVLES